MSYTNKTEFYEIPLPIESDLFNPMDWNESMEAVDTALHTAAIDSDTAVDTANAASDAAAAATAGLEELSGIVNTEKGKLTALTARVTSAENEIDDVRADASDMITAFNEPTATSTHAYAIGDTFIYNNVLYRATAAIDVSDTIVPNTNCEAINVETQIDEIIDNLNSKYILSSQNTISVTGNGVKTLATLMTELMNKAINNIHLASNERIRFTNLRLTKTASAGIILTNTNEIMSSSVSSSYTFSGIQNGTSDINISTAAITTTTSNATLVNLTGTSSQFNDISNVVPNNGQEIYFEYLIYTVL